MLQIPNYNTHFPLSAPAGVSQGLSLSIASYNYAPVLRSCPPTFSCLKMILLSVPSSHSNAFSGLLSDAAFAQESSPLCFHKVPLMHNPLFSLNVMLDQTCFPKKRHIILLRENCYNSFNPPRTVTWNFHQNYANIMYTSTVCMA